MNNTFVTNRLILKIIIALMPYNWSFGMVDGVVITGEKTIDVPASKQDLPIECKLDDSIKKPGCLQFSAKSKNRINNKQLTFYTIDAGATFKKTLAKKLAQMNDNQLSVMMNDDKLANAYQQNLHFLVDLGMSNVPVLDQGNFGTCATFSTTAVLDALKNAGDYASQQCLLELGTYEEQNIDAFSGWEGSDHYTILNRIQHYGIVDKKKCPHNYGGNNFVMQPEIYFTYSANGQWSHDFQWQNLDPNDSTDTDDTAALTALKKHIDSGHRVLIGTLLLLDQAVGQPINNKKTGLWDVPVGYSMSQFKLDVANDKIGGHSMIVIGYDDTKQLLKIRNSWGTSLGDEGDFYMTYQYFKLFNIDTIAVY